MTNSKFSLLETKVKLFLNNESSGHDYSHAERVYTTACYLQQFEGGDLTVIGAAALVHDICRPWEKKTGKSHFGPEALEIIKKVLIDAKIDQAKIPSILDAVAQHDIYDWTIKQSKSIELQIVQDADNLDAIGAMGIARTFAFGGAKGLEMYIPGENLDFSADYIETPTEKTSAISHFYEKLLHIAENMNTQTGKQLAAKKHAIMEDFLKQFFAEWHGEFETK
ncbi:HD domain-containing protein [Candidatus Woesebacteria bacterium]|nr:HD domain-containing protein [Candidatus Woesebacteria bacterium]